MKCYTCVTGVCPPDSWNWNIQCGERAYSYKYPFENDLQLKTTNGTVLIVLNPYKNMYDDLAIKTCIIIFCFIATIFIFCGIIKEISK